MSIKVLDDAGLRAKGITYSRQHRDRLIKARKFPPPIALGDNRVGWIEFRSRRLVAATHCSARCDARQTSTSTARSASQAHQ